MKDIEYEFWIDYVRKIGLKHMAVFDRVLDLCCGTGNSMKPMLKYAGTLYGIDYSLDMLNQARKKKLKNLIAGDIRALPLKGEFTFVYSIFDSLNYLLEDEDLIRTFKEVRRVLIPGGMFIFDMNSVEGIRYIARMKEIVEEDKDIYSIWRYKLNGDIIVLYLTILPKGDKSGKRIDEVHRERGYSIKRVREFLINAHFKPITEYACFSMKRAKSSTKRVLYVAKAI